MAGNVQVSFEYPTARVDGEAIGVGEIEGVRIDARVPGSPEWAEVAFVSYPDTSRLFADLASGTWHFRGTVVGVDPGDDSEPLESTVEIPRAAMGPLQTFKAVLQ